jgi:hypothetical protein
VTGSNPVWLIGFSRFSLSQTGGFYALRVAHAMDSTKNLDQHSLQDLVLVASG